MVIFAAAFWPCSPTACQTTSKLYQVQRQPSISYLDQSGGLVAVRAASSPRR